MSSEQTQQARSTFVSQADIDTLNALTASMSKIVPVIGKLSVPDNYTIHNNFSDVRNTCSSTPNMSPKNQTVNDISQVPSALDD